MLLITFTQDNVVQSNSTKFIVSRNTNIVDSNLILIKISNKLTLTMLLIKTVAFGKEMGLQKFLEYSKILTLSDLLWEIIPEFRGSNLE